MRNLLITVLLGSAAVLTSACTTEPRSDSRLSSHVGTTDPMLVVLPDADDSTSSQMSVGAGDSLGQAIFSRQLAIARAKRQHKQEELVGASTDLPLSE